jgi:hypothetical protein
MEVGDDHPGHWFPVQRTVEDPLPELARAVEPDAGVDHRPARVVLEQVEVDVIEPEGERHAEPLDSRRHGDGAPERRGLRPGIVDTTGLGLAQDGCH